MKRKRKILLKKRNLLIILLSALLFPLHSVLLPSMHLHWELPGKRHPGNLSWMVITGHIGTKKTIPLPEMYI